MAIFFFFCFGLGMFGTILKDHLIKTLSFCSWGLPRLWPTFEQTYDNGGGAALAQWINLRLPSFGPRFKSQAHH